ncbi:MAG: integrase core domain-containing protein, partial [Desulfuromonadales bacterium]|nr:integrase core domain-containing protein [Desulfuromonadales bacterium]
FLRQVVDECPYTIEYTYSDNGKEFKGTGEHAFVKACSELGIGQKFTRIGRPQTNGKAERVIRTIMEMWHQQETFKDRKNRHFSLLRFINFYNTVKPHKGIDDLTPYEKLLDHFYGLKV